MVHYYLNYSYITLIHHLLYLQTADISLEETDNSYIEEENIYPKKSKRKVCSPPAFYSIPKYKSAITDEVHHEFYDYPSI